MRMISFAVLGTPGEVRGTLAVQILDEQGETILNPPPTEINIPEETGRKCSLIMAFPNVQFRQPGKHKFIMKLNDRVIQDASFVVKQNPAQGR